MRHLVMQLWREDEGVLTFEWILLITVLVIGIVSGLSAVRDAMISELGDVAEAMISLDQSFTIDHPLNLDVHTTDETAASDSGFFDQSGGFIHCDRTSFSAQGPNTDCDDDFFPAQP